ncbi:DUF2937 family protein [Pseudomonas sp. TCU-HL1]|uniref:DUF2937 family protein n=1 Tax=Pseudomonas sp. TCU-HL1 TaxID=1856685 RepID=UPI00083D09E8|nr:DUF2937 family protein [Pseudomonas sp. TCU-HL1]AOE84397.1 hypothetical protein THL1_1849 [Pseudomonas sp. TCU-HL1]
MLRSYLRLILFTLGLLVGVQVPGFIDDYAKRVDAHRLEAEQGLSGFRETAARFFEGNLDTLVAHYRASSDPVMRSDADSLASLVARNDLMQREWQALQGPWFQRAWHVLAMANPELRQETIAAYSYQLLLKPEAIAWGLSAGLLLAWVVESVLLLIGAAAGVGRSRKVQQRHWR